MWKARFAFASLLLAVGCGDSGDDGADDAGASGTGGGAGTATAGSGGRAGAGAGGTAGTAGSSAGSAGSGGSGAVARGAVSVNVLAPESCSLDPQFVDFPTLGSGHPVTATDKAGLVEDGGMSPDGERVELGCTLFPNGIGFDAVISIGPSATAKAVNINGFSSALGVGVAAEGGLVLVSVFPEQYNAPSRSCTHTLLEFDMARGTIWGSFECPTLQEFEGDDACAVGPSYYYFENCSPPN